jgi:hypothetical protein
MSSKHLDVHKRTVELRKLRAEERNLLKLLEEAKGQMTQLQVRVRRASQIRTLAKVLSS